MVARMKVEDRCCKSKAVLGYDLFRPKRAVVTIPSFLPGETRDKRDLGRWNGEGGVSRMGGKRDRRKNLRKEEEKKACNTGAVKTASFLDITYLSTVEERGRNKAIQKRR